MTNHSDLLEALGIAVENSEPVDLYSNIVHIDIDETEQLLKAINVQILDELDHMDEVSIL